MEIATPHGPARVRLEPVDAPRGALVLGHGAAGGVAAVDLLATARAAHGLGLSVALVEQPYRVAGRRSPAPVGQLDAAWLAVIAELRRTSIGELPVLVGGRSSGARVACRTAGQAGAAGVICLAFPVHPPGKGDDPAKSRLPELDAVTVATLVIQGRRDPFGMPPAAPNRRVTVLPGEHSLRDGAAVEAAVRDWLTSEAGELLED